MQENDDINENDEEEKLLIPLKWFSKVKCSLTKLPLANTQVSHV